VTQHLDQDSSTGTWISAIGTRDSTIGDSDLDLSTGHLGLVLDSRVSDSTTALGETVLVAPGPRPVLLLDIKVAEAFEER
jgi:hypothetical protein